MAKAPPTADAGTRTIPLLPAGANTITPSGLQEPPRPSGALAKSWMDPLSTWIRFSLPPAKKPSHRLSGDQNGSWASSVPGSGRAVTTSSDRTQSRERLSDNAVKAMARPSGETASDAPLVDGG